MTLSERAGIVEKETKYPVRMDDLLRLIVENKASDLHLTAGSKPLARIFGELVALEYPKMTTEDVEGLLSQIVKAYHMDRLKEDWELDFSHSIPGVSRFRGNVMFQRNSLSAALRVIPYEIPDIEALGLPPAIKKLCYLSRGLILVTGPTGSGKSTTMAAMIDVMNKERNLNIVTVEDPIEFMHVNKKSTIRQREVGVDTRSFASALRHVLRHDPDVILIGEMRDLESIHIALTAAETGHLVISTLHTQTAPLTIHRVVDVFQEHQREQVRQQLADALRGVISQQILPNVEGDGRVVAVEYMAESAAVKNLIREGKIHQLYTAIQTGQSQDMQTMDMALARLCLSGKISRELAYDRCVDRVEFQRILERAGTGDFPRMNSSY